MLENKQALHYFYLEFKGLGHINPEPLHKMLTNFDMNRVAEY